MHKIFGGCVVAFQSAFYLEIHQNNIFFIFKKLFLISAHQNNLKTQKYIISCVMLRVELFFKRKKNYVGVKQSDLVDFTDPKTALTSGKNIV